MAGTQHQRHKLVVSSLPGSIGVSQEHITILALGCCCHPPQMCALSLIALSASAWLHSCDVTGTGLWITRRADIA